MINIYRSYLEFSAVFSELDTNNPFKIHLPIYSECSLNKICCNRWTIQNAVSFFFSLIADKGKSK